MGSRFVIGASAWLLGAASATAGSLYAVSQLGRGLVEQHSSQVSVAMVNAELAREGALRHTGFALSLPPSASPKVSHSSAPPRSVREHQATPTPPVPYPVTSEGGSAEAVCGPGGAQLVGESPAQGFAARDVVQGPSAVVSVTFINDVPGGPSIGVIMKVTCNSAGVPVAQSHEFQLTGWSQHHGE